MSEFTPTPFDSLIQPNSDIAANIGEFRAPRILIVTDNASEIIPLRTHLKRLNYDVQIAFYNGTKLSSTPKKPPVAIIVNLTSFNERSEDICTVLKQHYASQPIPMIGVLDKVRQKETSNFDSVVIGPSHASQIANRVNSFIRLSAMETEITLRFETLQKDFGQPGFLQDTGDRSPFRVLFIGKATAAFMVVINALQMKNVEVVAAFTSFSAFDYLHDSDFDAVVMNALEQAEPALSISQTMRRNARLYHVPTLFLVDETNFNYADKAYESGARDIIDIHAETEEISGRIIELANYHRLHSELKQGFESLGGHVCITPHSQCYNHNFMDRHSERVVRSCHNAHQPVAFMALKLLPDCSEPPLADNVISAIADIGQMLKNLVRMQDTVSHYHADTYLMSLPNTNAYEASIVLERMKALVDCTAYESGIPNTALSFSIEASYVEVEPHETSFLAIGRLFNQLNNMPYTHERQIIA